jgi:two-component system, OmpR family, sensor kinase
VGRLFWKFFFFFMLAQVTTVVAVSSAIWLRHRNQFAATEVATAPAPGAEPWRGGALPPPPRDGADGVPPDRRGPGGPRGPGRPDGPGGPGGPGDRPPQQFPIEPIAGGIFASLVFAALLAWYVSKPIRSLRRAFDAAAQGNLDVRVGDGIGQRRDELADLGHDFDRTAAQLKRLMDGQRRLLHDVSHELRSPLARLQAAVGLARQQPANIEASMERIEREAVRMDKLVDELLTLSRVEAGLGRGPQEDVDVIDLVTEVAQDAAFEAQAGAIPVALDTDLDALKGARVNGHPEMLHRALENVMRNAVRHSSAGGRVRIAGRRDAARHEIVIAIEDAGPGVAPAELESIFEPFFRGAQAKGTRGHGLGLAIARRVVEAHGGRIAAANRASGGLAVEIRLPA